MTRVLYTIMVAVIMMLALPVSQLRLVTIKIECCCPDPSRCHCPEDAKQAPAHTTMKACHKTTETISSSPVSEITVPAIAVTDVVTPRIALVEFPVSQPHAPPAPDQPRGPS